MQYFYSILLGVIEGATEYLPISSTFHLIWVSRLLNIPQTEFQKSFEVIIQSGAILAVVLLYFSLIKGNRSLILKVLISFMPTALIGFVFYKIIKNFFFENFFLQLTVFIGVGIFFIFFEKNQKKEKLSKNLNQLTISQALIIGVIQALAVIPGVSRAGAVIVGLIFFRLNRRDAAIYSFLLAVPTLLAASALDFIKTYPQITSHPENFSVLLAGFLSAFVSALIVVKWFINFLQKHSLSAFGIYRIALGFIILAISLIFSF